MQRVNPFFASSTNDETQTSLQKITTSARASFNSALGYTISSITYFASKVEHRLVGDLRQLISDPRDFKAEIEKTGFKSFGVLGKVVSIKVTEEKLLAELLKTLDKQPGGRLGYQPLSLLTGGQVFFCSRDF